MSEKGLELGITIDRGKDRPEDHKFVEQLQSLAVQWFSRRGDGSEAQRAAIAFELGNLIDRVKLLEEAAA